MAKKNTKNTDQPGNVSVAAPPKRRAAGKKQPAAPPVDVATVSGTEPIDSASDRRTGTNGVAGTTETGTTEYQPSHEEIAQAAYFRHLQRGGTEGADFEDWLEAERELKQRRR